VPILHLLITIYIFVLIARAVTSWFPPSQPGTPFAFITQVLRDLTEPVVAPFRRVIPPAGMFDISYMVVVFIFIILQSVTR
jgi:YggT family protein